MYKRQELLSATRKGRGCRRAERSILFADGDAESPGESLSRVRMYEGGLVMPVLQKEIRDAHGRLLGRTDFWWEAVGVVGEFDGKVKYDELVASDVDVADVVMDEKQREQSIQDEVRRVVRWTWADLWAVSYTHLDVYKRQALQYLKKPDVGQAFSMQMVTGPPGIGGLLSKHGRSGDPAFAPREGTGQDASGDRYRQPGTGHPDPAKTGSNGDGGRPDQREPRVTAQRGRFRNSGRDGGIHRPESSQGYPKFPEWSAAWRRRPCRDGECGTPVPGTRPPPPTRHWPPRQSPN